MDEEFERQVKDAAERFRSGQSDLEELESPAGLMRFVRDPDVPGRMRVEVEADGGTVTIVMRSFSDAPERPSDYPPALPFLPDCPAILNETANSVTWMGPTDPEHAFQHVITECIAGGWQRVDLHPVIAGSGSQQQAEFQRADQGRTLMLLVRNGHATLSLMHHPARPKEAEK